MIPYPNSNPLSQMQSLVSCPNYTYEIGAWVCFSVMTQCLPAALFTLAGFYQMAVWALGKHRNYKKEFKAGLIDIFRKSAKKLTVKEIMVSFTDGAKYSF